MENKEKNCPLCVQQKTDDNDGKEIHSSYLKQIANGMKKKPAINPECDGQYLLALWVEFANALAMVESGKQALYKEKDVLDWEDFATPPACASSKKHAMAEDVTSYNSPAKKQRPCHRPILERQQSGQKHATAGQYPRKKNGLRKSTKASPHLKQYNSLRGRSMKSPVEPVNRLPSHISVKPCAKIDASSHVSTITNDETVSPESSESPENEGPENSVTGESILAFLKKIQHQPPELLPKAKSELLKELLTTFVAIKFPQESRNSPNMAVAITDQLLDLINMINKRNMILTAAEKTELSEKIKLLTDQVTRSKTIDSPTATTALTPTPN